jgi:hypothetical protein
MMQFVATLDQVHHGVDHQFQADVPHPYQNDSDSMSVREHELTEIFVPGTNDAILGRRASDQILIGSSRRGILVGPENLVTCRTKTIDETARYIGVGKKLHPPCRLRGIE